MVHLIAKSSAHARSPALVTSSAASPANTAPPPSPVLDRAPQPELLPHNAHLPQCRKAAQSIGDFQSHSSRHKAATDAPYIRFSGTPPAASYPESKSFPASDAPVLPMPATESSSPPRYRPE